MNKYKFDPTHSSVEFSVRHLGISWVHGRFTDIHGSAEFEADNLEKFSVEAEVETKSIWTSDANRDNHLRSKDFFDCEHYPLATFKSIKVEKISDNEYKVTGDLTIRGVTKSLTLKLQSPTVREIPSGEGDTSTMKAGFSVKTTINRHDFGISWDAPAGKGATTVGGEVDITINIEAIKE